VVKSARRESASLERRKEGGKQRTPQLNLPIVAARDDKPTVELEARDAVLVSLKDVNGFVVWVIKVEDEDATVRTASNENVGDWVELKLADEGGVALEEGEEFAVQGGKRRM
jgi:hypothetical protein